MDLRRVRIRAARVALPSIIARDRAILGGDISRQIDENFVAVTPAPALRRVISFDDGMVRRMEMRSRMLPRRLVATTDVTAGAADP
jgi:hypothetical protein